MEIFSLSDVNIYVRDEFRQDILVTGIDPPSSDSCLLTITKGSSMDDCLMFLSVREMYDMLVHNSDRILNGHNNTLYSNFIIIVHASDQIGFESARMIISREHDMKVESFRGMLYDEMIPLARIEPKDMYTVDTLEFITSYIELRSFVATNSMTRKTRIYVHFMDPFYIQNNFNQKYAYDFVLNVFNESKLELKSPIDCITDTITQTLKSQNNLFLRANISKYDVYSVIVFMSQIVSYMLEEQWSSVRSLYRNRLVQERKTNDLIYINGLTLDSFPSFKNRLLDINQKLIKLKATAKVMQFLCGYYEITYTKNIDETHHLTICPSIISYVNGLNLLDPTAYDLNVILDYNKKIRFDPSNSNAIVKVSIIVNDSHIRYTYQDVSKIFELCHDIMNQTFQDDPSQPSESSDEEMMVDVDYES